MWLMGMRHWIGSHFYDRIDYNGVSFSTELRGWGRTFSDFWGKKILVSRDSKWSRLNNRSINRKWLRWDRKNHIVPKVTEMGSITGRKMDYNGAGLWELAKPNPSTPYPPTPPTHPRLKSPQMIIKWSQNTPSAKERYFSLVPKALSLDPGNEGKAGSLLRGTPPAKENYREWQSWAYDTEVQV